MFGNIMQMFRQGAAQPQATVQLNPGQVQVPLNQQQQQQIQDPSQLINPQPNPALAVKEPSPEDTFKDFWNIDPKKDTLPQNIADFNFNFDPAKVTETVNKMDFTQGISSDLVKKVAAGGEEAVSAMMTMMNHVGQQVMKNSVIAGARVTESGLKSTGQRLATELPNMMRQQSVSGALREDNPLFNDPSTAPMLAAVEQQMTIKFPQATAQEIRESAKQYMANFATKAAQFAGLEIGPASKTPTQAQKAIQTDWSNEPI